LCVCFFCTVSAADSSKSKEKDKSQYSQKEKDKSKSNDKKYSKKEKERKKQKGLDKVAPSIGEGEKAAGILDKISKGAGKIVDKLLPAPGAKEVGDAAGETAKGGAKAVKKWRTRGEAVIGDDGMPKIYNEETGEWEDF
jgi:hypothetical protein